MRPAGRLPPHPVRPARETRAAEAPEDDVTLNSAESFPASDPPSWTPIARVGAPENHEMPATGGTSARR